jgi:threonine/homoserine/homoserine lactone efflux protein
LGVGAAYLVWVGYKMMRHPRRSFVAEVGERDTRGKRIRHWGRDESPEPEGRYFLRFLSAAICPAWCASRPYIMLLGTIHALLGVAWFACLIAATRRIAGFLQRPVVVHTCDRLTGGVFMAFGVGLALESRRP